MEPDSLKKDAAKALGVTAVAMGYTVFCILALRALFLFDFLLLLCYFSL